MWFQVITKVFNGKHDGSLANNAVVVQTVLDPEVLPDQIASFNDMPLLVVAPHMMEASGFMRVSRSDGGNFNAMICVRKRKMSMSSEHQRVRPVHSL